MKRALLFLYDFFYVRKPLFYSITIGLFVVAGVIASCIHIEEDISKMMPAGHEAQKATDILSHSGFADKIVVKITQTRDSNPEALTTLADSFEQRLLRDYSDYVSEIKTRVSDHTILDIYSTIHEHLPVYLDSTDYVTIDSLISPLQVRSTLGRDYKILTSPAGMVLKKMIADDPTGISNIALRKLQGLQINNEYDLYDGYIMTKDHRSLVLFVTSRNPGTETSKNAKLIAGLDKVILGLSTTDTGAEIDYYGGIAVAVGNAQQSRQDTYVTLSITIVLLLLFIGFFFRRKRVPFVMMLPVVFGALFSLALISIFQGHISVIAVGAGSVVLGIAINYSLHFFSHYKHCGSVRETIADLLMPMTIGSFTTVGSFFSLVLLRSPLLKDFGLFAGFSLTGATIFALVFLPHFIGAGADDKIDVIHESWFDKIPRLPAKYNIVLVIGICTVTIFLFPRAMKVGFDSDISRLNFMTDKLKHSEKEIMDLGGSGSVQTAFIATTGGDMQRVLENNEALLRKLDTAAMKGYITGYSSISSFLPSGKVQRRRIGHWNAYWTKEKKEQLIQKLQSEGKMLGFRPTAFDAFDDLINKAYQPAGDTAFAGVKTAFGSEYIISNAGSQTIVNSVKVIDSLRPKLYAQLGQDTSTVILDKKLITNKLIDIIFSDFNSILAYSSLLVFLALLFSYGRLELTILTFLPMLISWIWILGIMYMLDIKFNILSIILSTFIFGIGDDFSIFITDGLTRKYREGKQTITSHNVSIYLSAGTTLIGLGALIFARHPAMHSIAGISIIGICCVVFIGQTIQPFLYDFFIQSRKDKGQAPWTFLKLVLSIFAFSYFVLGSFFLTLVGFILMLPIPLVGKKKKKVLYHILLSALLRSLVYIMVNVRKVHIDKELMDFSKPAVIIANHQSFLDILVIAMQHPKLIMFTNSWTYHSPFFGKVIQLADYHPVSAGIDDSLDKFRNLIADGYSIVVFPEGTRSSDNIIKRFHKGAFYLAEKLHLDIVPLILHGIGDTMRKGDFMLMNGQMTMKYLPRIKADDKNYGIGYAEKTKNISRYFRDEYNKLRGEMETAKYYKERVRLNYIYKGPFLEFYTRSKLRKEGYYSAIHDQISRTGIVTILGSSYGFMSYMLHFLGSDRIILGIDHNAEKIDVANNCYSKDDRIHFEHGDILNHPFQNSDTFVIDGILQDLDMALCLQVIQSLTNRLNHGGKIIIKNKEGKVGPVIRDIAGTLDLDFFDVDSTVGGIWMLSEKAKHFVKVD